MSIFWVLILYVILTLLALAVSVAVAVWFANWFAKLIFDTLDGTGRRNKHIQRVQAALKKDEEIARLEKQLSELKSQHGQGEQP